MVKLNENNTGGVTLEDADDFIKNIEKRVYDEYVNKKISILHQGTMSDKEFKALYDKEYDKYKKELKKLLRTAYTQIFNPLKTLEGLEYIWYKYVFIGVLSDEYVETQRNRMYDAMRYPTDDIKEKAMQLKEKIKNKFNL